MLNKKEDNWWFKFKMFCEDVWEFVVDFTGYLIRFVIAIGIICVVAGVLLSPFAVLKYLFF